MVNFFATTLVSHFILPFLLVFVVVFAILQKSKILGADKTQIDSLVALAIALLLIATPIPRNFIVEFTPWVAVGVVIILVFLLLYGFIAEDSWKGELWIKIVFGILSGLFVIGLVLYFSGFWELEFVKQIFSIKDSGSLWANFLLILVVVGALAVALSSGNSNKSSNKKSST